MGYPVLCHLTSITASESVSDDWKVANVVPVYKEGSRNVATSPDKVLQVSCVTKIFEKIVSKISNSEISRTTCPYV